MKPQLGDFILTKCSAADFFDQSVCFEKMAQHSHVFNIGKAKCTICSETLDIEDTSDMYKHLFLKHKNDFVSSMILTDMMVDHVIVEDIKFVKEEVRAVAVISNCIGFSRRVFSVRVRAMIKKKARDIVIINHLDSKVFANEDVLKSFLSKVEIFLGEDIVD